MSRGIQAGPGTALLFAFLWGILSVVLSPCHLAGIPLLVGFLSGQDRGNPRRALLVSTVFSLGILLSIAVIAGITAMLGRLLGNLGPWMNYLVAVILFFFGFHLMGLIPLIFPGAQHLAPSHRGPGAAFALGAIFGLALGPCTFAYMAPVMAASVQVATVSMVASVALVSAFGLGHCAVIVGAGVSAHQVQEVLKWNQRSQGLENLRQLCGLLVILGGLYLIYRA